MGHRTQSKPGMCGTIDNHDASAYCIVDFICAHVRDYLRACSMSEDATATPIFYTLRTY